MRDITIEIINTTKQIGDLVDWLILRHASPELYKPTMYIDLEGIDLCREGSLSILTLLIDTGIPTIRVCLVDVYSLGSQAFNTTGIKPKTLKDILQDENIPKVFFDVRNDSDALFAHFGVALQGVEDVQLMESATRTTTRSRKYLNSLARCVENYVLYDSDLTRWKLANEKGERLFKAEHGGSYEIFNQRPIPDDIISYCVGDVQYLPTLWDRFRWRTNRWRDLVNDKTKQRVAASQKPEYQPHGPDRTLAPWSEDENRTLDKWNYVPPSRDYLGYDYFNDDCFGDDYFGDDWDDGQGDNDFEDWTRADWQGPPS
ncbi:ribonuclease H-like domain-containing protein [Bisporella sp. PMI_857]|nr:ribonuclease H-like domain-containing protein [Bisporella sp. PMI_857]